jgi:hypothetical protein
LHELFQFLASRQRPKACGWNSTNWKNATIRSHPDFDDNRRRVWVLRTGRGGVRLFPDIASVCRHTADQQPGRDAKVLTGNQPGMWERDQTDSPNKSLIGSSPTPAPMSFGAGVLVSPGLVVS